MSREQIKNKLRENAIAYVLIMLLGSGGGSAVTALRGPDGDEMKAVQKSVHALETDVAVVKSEVARVSENVSLLIDLQLGAKRVSTTKH